jgi:zinc transport system permease protein
MGTGSIDMQFILALAMGTLVGGAAGYLGTLMLSKRMALVAGPLGHLTLPGIALALTFGFDVSLGAFPMVVLGILFIWLFEIKSKLPMEALTAVVFASGVAITFLFLPEEQTVPALIGDISQISFLSTAITVILCAVILVATSRIYPSIVLIGISEDLAQSSGVHTRKYNFVYLACIALMVSLGVRIVGGLMTAALSAIPACTSYNLSKNQSEYSYRGIILGSSSCILGIIGFMFTGIPAGLLIILVSTSFFIVSLSLKR